jgi:hypothetical protein
LPPCDQIKGESFSARASAINLAKHMMGRVYIAEQARDIELIAVVVDDMGAGDCFIAGSGADRFYAARPAISGFECVLSHGDPLQGYGLQWECSKIKQFLSTLEHHNTG